MKNTYVDITACDQRDALQFLFDKDLAEFVDDYEYLTEIMFEVGITTAKEISADIPISIFRNKMLMLETLGFVEIFQSGNTNIYCWVGAKDIDSI